MIEERRSDDLVQDMDVLQARVCGSQRQLLQLIVHADRAEVWRDSGARDLAHWISMRYGISWWKANRWIRAAHALEELPSIARALERLAENVPVMPEEEEEACYADARRADALVALCSARIAADADPDRATVVVHASPEALVAGDRSCELEGGGVIHPETARRLACTARLQAVLEDRAGDPVRVGRLSREPSAWMLRQLRHRDRECRFPGCGARWFNQAHHVLWWEHGGPTDLGNLVLVCTFHHRLVHEHGWAEFEDRGARELKGVPGEWALYEVTRVP